MDTINWLIAHKGELLAAAAAVGAGLHTASSIAVNLIPADTKRPRLAQVRKALEWVALNTHATGAVPPAKGP